MDPLPGGPQDDQGPRGVQPPQQPELGTLGPPPAQQQYPQPQRYSYQEPGYPYQSYRSSPGYQELPPEQQHSSRGLAAASFPGEPDELSEPDLHVDVVKNSLVRTGGGDADSLQNGVLR